MYRENAVYKVNHLIQIHIQIFYCSALFTKYNIKNIYRNYMKYKKRRDNKSNWSKEHFWGKSEKRAALCTHYECLPIAITKICLPNMNFQNICVIVLTADVKMSTQIKPLKLARFLKSTQRTHYYTKTWAYPSVTLSRQFIFYQLLRLL